MMLVSPPKTNKFSFSPRRNFIRKLFICRILLKKLYSKKKTNKSNYFQNKLNYFQIYPDSQNFTIKLWIVPNK